MRIVVSFLLLALSCEAAVRYIRDGATGIGDGSSWANAYDDLGDATFTRGNTYYIAGGGYNGLTIGVSDNSSWITIKKANAADNGSDPGWSASYASATCTITSTLALTYGHFEVNGVTGSETSGHGIKILLTNNASGITTGNGSGPYHFYHVEVCGPGVFTQSQGGDGINNNNVANKNSGMHIAYCWIHGVDRNGLTLGGLTGTSYVDYGFLYESNVLSETGGSSDIGWHGQGMQLAFDNTNRFCIIRNNTYRNIKGSGSIVFMGGDSSHENFLIYNNVFYSTNGAEFPVSPGVINNLSVGVACTNIQIANNTFYGISGSGTNLAQIRIYGPNTNNCWITNCLWENCYFSAAHVIGEQGNNGYYGNTGSGVPSGTAGQVDGASTTFNAPASYDFTLKAGGYAVGAGADLSGIFTTDILGRTRGAWDIGAYAFTLNRANITNLRVKNLHIGGAP